MVDGAVMGQYLFCFSSGIQLGKKHLISKQGAGPNFELKRVMILNLPIALVFGYRIKKARENPFMFSNGIAFSRKRFILVWGFLSFLNSFREFLKP